MEERHKVRVILLGRSVVSSPQKDETGRRNVMKGWTLTDENLVAADVYLPRYFQGAADELNVGCRGLQKSVRG